MQLEIGKTWTTPWSVGMWQHLDHSPGLGRVGRAGHGALNFVIDAKDPTDV